MQYYFNQIDYGRWKQEPWMISMIRRWVIQVQHTAQFIPSSLPSQHRCRLGRVVRRWFLRYQLESNGEISGRNGKKLWNFLSFRKMTHFHSVSLFCLTLKSLLKNVEKWQIIKNRVKNSLYIKYHAIFGISTKKYYKMTCDTIIL